MPNTFDAIAIDLTDRTSPYGSVHIRDKTSVADRLFAGALCVAYGDKTSYWQGPVATSATAARNKRLLTDGVGVTVKFANCGDGGLQLANTSGWELCVLGGTNNCSQSSTARAGAAVGEWAPAMPTLKSGLSSSSSSSVEVTVSDTQAVNWLRETAVASTVLVRYAWYSLAFEYKQAGLYGDIDGSNMPASPFILVAK